jgi:hypothetical protein
VPEEKENHYFNEAQVCPPPTGGVGLGLII